MVIKGKSVAGARRLAVHLTRTDTNETAQLLEMRGTAAEDLRGGLVEIDAVASGTRCSKPFYHASINTRADEKLSDAQRLQAIDRLERELGLTDQPRAVVVHVKEGREHCHIVWSRIDLDRMAAISDSHNYRKHELVARELEREFGHARVQGVHVERDGQARPERTPSHAEMQMAARGGASPEEARALITSLWERTDNGQSFRQALGEEGWLLARGDRRDYVALDPAGCVHSLARRVEGANAADIRVRLADLADVPLPTVAEGRELQRGRQLAATPERGDQPLARGPAEPSAGRGPEPVGPIPLGGAIMMADAAGKAAEKMTDYVAGLMESIGGGEPQRSYTAADLARDPAARRDAYRAQAADRASDGALERMRLDLEQGRGVSPGDVRNLTQAHLLQLNAHGDDYLRQAIRDHEESSRDPGRERER